MDTETILKWQQIIADQLASGLSVRAFCRANGISNSSFYTYKIRLEKLGITAETPISTDFSAIAEKLGEESEKLSEEKENTEPETIQTEDTTVWKDIVCLVDTENIGKDWPSFMLNNKGISSFVLFYTPSSAGISVSDFMILLHSTMSINAISCYTGKNALDFQLVTYLGSEIALHPERSYCILSNDTGYDSVVKFWKDRDITIARCKARDRLIPDSKEQPKAVEKAKPVEKEIKHNDKNAKNTEKDKKQKKEETPVSEPVTVKAVPVEDITEMMTRFGAQSDNQDELSKVAVILSEKCGTDKKTRKTIIYQAFFKSFGKSNGQDVYSKYKKIIGNVLSEYDAKAAKV